MTAPGGGGRRGKTSEPAVLLRGAPSRLTAAAPLLVDVGRVGARRLPAAAVSVLIEGALPERVRVRAPRTPGGAPELRVKLARSTPPGRYEGAATVGDRKIPIVIEVEPAPRLRSSPSRVETTGTPAGSETVELQLANSGNVPIEVPARSSFCLFDGGGIDHAMWAAFATDLPEGKGRLDVLLDDLAASHGGLVDVRVRDGAGAIAPGETRTCRVELRWSDRLRPGRRYVGAWDVADLRLPIRVETAREPKGAAARVETAREPKPAPAKPRVKPAAAAKASTTPRRAR